MVFAEAIKLLAASAFLGMGSILDIFNKKELPDNLLYLMLGFSLLLSAVLNGELFSFSVMQAVVVLAVGYLLYKGGVMGLADPIYFAIISLLYPLLPNSPIPLPTILVVLIYSGIAFGLFTMFYYAYRLMKEGAGKPDLKGLLIVPAYAFFAYTYARSGLGDPLVLAIATLVTLPATFVALYSKRIKELMETTIPVEESLEEVLSDNESEEVKGILKGERVLKKEHVAALKKRGIKKVKVYGGMLPFIPFLAVGFALAYVFGFPLTLP